MAPAPTRIYDICVDMLSTVVANHGGTLPARQYVSAGPPAWDCELVAVHCISSASPTGADPIARSAGHLMRSAQIVVTIVRCVPTVDTNGMGVSVPSVTEEQAAAAALYGDAQRIVNAVAIGEAAGTIGSCWGVRFLDFAALGPEGGFAGASVSFEIALTGA